MQRRFNHPRFDWTTAAAVVAIVLFVAALRNDFYQLTSPSTLSWHVALRKTYSLAAFGVLGYLLRRALIARGRQRVVSTTIASLALYSGAIEIGQFLLGSTEGIGWNVVDIACGAVGGVFATADLLAGRAVPPRRHPYR